MKIHVFSIDIKSNTFYEYVRCFKVQSIKNKFFNYIFKNTFLIEKNWLFIIDQLLKYSQPQFTKFNPKKTSLHKKANTYLFLSHIFIFY